MEQQISFDDDDTLAGDEGTISFDPQSPMVDDITAEKRATRADFALGEKSPGRDMIYSAITSGSEDMMRRQYALQKDLDLNAQKTQMIAQYAKQKAAAGGQITNEEVEFFQSMARGDLEEFNNNPDTFFEKEYGKRFLEKYGSSRNDGVWMSAKEEDPEGTQKVLDAATRIKQRNEIARTILEEQNAKYKEMGAWETMTSWGELFIPGKSTYNMHDAVKQTSGLSTLLQGNNRVEQYAYLHTLPPDEFNQALRAAAEDISSRNVLDAIDFVQGALSYSVDDRNLANAFDVLDAVDIAGVAGGLAKVGAKGVVAGAKAGAKVAGKAAEQVLENAPQGVKTASARSGLAVERLKNVVKGMLKADKDGTLDEAAIVGATGRIDESAVLQAAKSARDRLKGVDPLNEGISLANEVPSIFNPKNIIGDVGKLGRERANQLLDTLTSSADNLLNAVVNPGAVERLGARALEAGLANTERQLRERYVKLNNSILDVEHRVAEDNAAHVNMVTIVVGDKDKKLFDSPAQAAFFGTDVYKIPVDTFRVVPKGEKFAIEVTKPVDETTDVVRDVLIETDRQSKKGIFNTLAGFLRSAEDLVSPAQSRNRHIATHAAQELQAQVHAAAKPLMELSKDKERFNDLKRILIANRDHLEDEYKMGPNGPYKTGHKLRGKMYDNVAQLETAYMDMHKRLPTEKEVAAYFNYKQLMDFDYVMRNLGIYRDKVRQGAEKVHVNVSMDSDQGRHFKELSFEGVVKDDLPWGGPDAGVWVQNKDGTGALYRMATMPSEVKVQIDEMIKQGGGKVLQVFNPMDKPLRQAAGTDETIHFMVTDSFSVSKLDWKQLPYRAGVHVEYNHPWFVKQPKLRRADGYHTKEDTRHIYEGDISLLNVATEAEARKFAERMDTARKMIKNKDPGADKYITENLPFDSIHFRSFFDEWKDEAGNIQPPKLHLDDEITFTTSGRNVFDMKGEEYFKNTWKNFENDIRNPYNLFANVDKKFGGTRDPDLPNYKQGENENALLTLDDPSLLDPYETLNRSLGNVMRSRFFADYKISAVEDWIQEFHRVMKVPGGLQELRRDPMWYLHNPVWDSTHQDKDLLRAAQNSRNAILNFIGTEDEWSKGVNWLGTKLQNEIYERMGKKYSDRIAESKLPSIKDPVTALRGFAFHTKLGFFNPVQLLMQAQSAIHVAALGGTKAWPGMNAAVAMRYFDVNKHPEVVSAVAEKVAKASDWKKEHFIESWENLQKTGFWHVEGETAWRDDVFNPKLIKSGVSSVLDKGLVFFREGERMVRLAAWNTAYREWRDANPTAKLTNDVRNRILQRADTMTVNMTRASNAGWQKGLLTIPTQFLGYQMRLTEQFIGGRLTWGEKARALAIYSAAYGIPIGASVATAVPFYDGIRTSFLEKGVDMDSAAVQFFMTGIFSTLLSQATGKEYNVSERFGPGGLKIFSEIANGEKSWVEVMAGPSGAILEDAWNSTFPLRKMVTGIFSDKEDERFPMTADVFLDVARNISTLNSATKMIAALNTGQYITKNEVNLGDVTTMDAILMGFAGVQPTQISDAYLKMKSLKEVSDAQTEMKKLLIGSYRRGIKEAHAGNAETADKYLKQAKAYFIAGGWQPHQYADLVKEALNGYASLADKIDVEFVKKSGREQRDARMEQLIKQQQKAQQ